VKEDELHCILEKYKYSSRSLETTMRESFKLFDIYDTQSNLEKYVFDFLDYSFGIKSKKDIYRILNDKSPSSKK